MMSTRNRSPFTPTQWQELQHQALVYKYIVCGVPIPPELIYSVKRSLDSSLASRLFPNQPSEYANHYFEVGFDRKVDPEPGRCRRTDGKKWRCSKEAYPDSKYCERHMHRGRNRSRKPVEISSSTISSTKTTPTPAILSPSISSINRNLSISTNSTIPSISPFTLSPLPSSSSLVSEIYTPHNPIQDAHFNSFLQNSHSPSSSRPPGPGLTLQNQSSLHFLDSGTGISYPQADIDYRCFPGTREGVDERVFFPEASESSCRSFSQSQYQSSIDSSKQQQHCFVLGTDIRSTTAIKLEKEDENQKPVHQFFGDWPPNNNNPWLDLASNSRVHTDS